MFYFAVYVRVVKMSQGNETLGGGVPSHWDGVETLFLQILTMTMAMVIITVTLLMEVSHNMSVGVRSDFVVSHVSVCGQLSVQQAVTAADVQPMN